MRGKKMLKVVLPLVVLLAGFLGVGFMAGLREEPEVKKPQKHIPLVLVQQVQFSDYRFEVKSQGTVRPKTTIQLVPEISGRVVEMASGFTVGGFFKENDILFKVDGFNYQRALVTARADLASAKLMLSREEAETLVARDEWRQLGNGEKNPLVLRELQLEEAQASVQAAQARVELAERNLERTTVRAPFPCRVQEKTMDLGQFLTVGVPVAKLYSLEFMEVRLPVATGDTSYLNLPMGVGQAQQQPEVTLLASMGDELHQWQGLIIGTESEVDPKTRMLQAIAQVGHPFQPGGDLRFPLTPGLFVDAVIQGREVSGVAILPRSALWEGDKVLIVDEQQKLQFRTVQILRKTENEIIVNAGLEDGDQVCLSRLEAVVEGMSVRIAREPSNPGAERS